MTMNIFYHILVKSNMVMEHTKGIKGLIKIIITHGLKN